MSIEEILKDNGFGEFLAIKENELYQNSKYNAFVYNTTSFAKALRKVLLEEIPYMENDFLKKHLPEKFSSVEVLNDYKELSKFDHTMLSNSILDIESFLIESMIQYTGLKQIELLHPNATIIQQGENKIIVSEI